VKWLGRKGAGATGDSSSPEKSPPALGTLWAIEKVGSASYGLEFWKILWRIVPVKKLAGATLYEGDTASTLRGQERLYCIGLGHSSPALLPEIRQMIEQSPAYGLVSASSLDLSIPRSNFLEGEALAREPLVEVGSVDSKGRVAGQGWALPALQAVSEEPKDLEGLVAALQDPNEGLRNHAALALGELGDTRAVDPLIHALEGESAEFRRRAAYSLGKLNDSRAATPLINALGDANSWVRVAAVVALWEMGEGRAVEALVEALDDEDMYVRGVAAQALGWLGGPRAIGPLANALSDDDGYVRTGAEMSLKQIGGPEAEAALRAHQRLF
jgi:hypothetical protein